MVSDQDGVAIVRDEIGDLKMAWVKLTGIKNIQRKLRKIGDFDPTNLLLTFEQVIEEDNRRGVLAGLDKDGQPLLPVTYRPRGQAVNIRSREAESKRMRNAARGNARRGIFAGFGPWASGLHNNLSHEEYLRLAGPPLVPRSAFSRVITNLVTSHIVNYATKIHKAVGGWKGVVSVTGFPFLKHLFAKRDIRGVRPAGMRKARIAARNYLRELFRHRGV
jgi:hypothetical protein